MPWWSGAVSNDILQVADSYIVLKVRAANGVHLSDWNHVSVDTNHAKHADWINPNYWKNATFTLFVFCPFDTKLGGPIPGKGTMTFPDFYPAECSSDGRLCSFLSRKGIRAYRERSEYAPKGQKYEAAAWYKGKFETLLNHFIPSNIGFIDRSAEVDKQGPRQFVEGEENKWTCETGILDGHNPLAITGLKTFFPVFKDGDFSQLLSYLEPNVKKPTVDEL